MAPAVGGAARCIAGWASKAGPGRASSALPADGPDAVVRYPGVGGQRSRGGSVPLAGDRRPGTKGRVAGSDGAHLLAANVLVAIVGLHVVAALYHRLVAKDGVWERMFGRDIGTEIQP
ncbi:cytochrome b/b6 domain-containing protein [Zobellella endophytica]|uniref:cytochrome b/b6 domain-containing protein n=1 Tax=Zobellella endophytica TaxID=2116700 RepID=UPI003182D062